VGNSVINLKNKSHSITAQVVVPEGGGSGVIIAQGGAFVGGRTATSTRPNPLTLVSAAGFVGMAVGTAILYLRMELPGARNAGHPED
jgi:hypothetical protein